MNEKSHWIIFALLAIASTLSACGSGDDKAPRVTIVVVGPAGATIDGPENTSLIIPPGALEASTEVKITATDILVPQVSQASSVISVEPVDTVFKKPSQIVIPYEAGTGTNEAGFNEADYNVLRAPRPGAAVKEWIPQKGVVNTTTKKVKANVMETGYFVVGINTESDTETDSDTDTTSDMETDTATETSDGTGTGEPEDSDTATPQSSDSADVPVDTGIVDTVSGDSDTDTGSACPSLPTGTLLFDIATMGNSLAFQYQGSLEAAFEWMSVTGQSFNGAVRTTTTDFSGLPADIQAHSNLSGSVNAGDHLALEFWTRCVASDAASCRTSVVLGESAQSNATIAAYYATATGTWTLHQVPFISPGDFTGTNYVSFHMGYANQSIEVAGVRLTNYGQIATQPRPDCLPDNTELYSSVQFVSSPVQSAYPGFMYNYAVEINGYPRPDVTYTSGPSWLTFDANSLLLSGVPPRSAIGTTETVTVTAAGISQTWSINITEAPETIGYWPFDESEGTLAADASTHSRNDAMIYGDPSWQPDGGHGGGAISLDSYTGAIDYIELPADTDSEMNSLQYSSYTISVWVKPNRVPQGTSDIDNYAASGIVLKRAGGGLNTGIYYTRDALFIATHAFSARAYAAYAGPYEAGAWHHVTTVCDLDAKTLTLYVDGLAQYTGPLTPPADDTDTSPDMDFEYGSTPWRIGLSEPNADIAGMYGDVIIDDLRFFSRALTASEIRNLQH